MKKNRDIYKRYTIGKHIWKIISREIVLLLIVIVVLLALEFALNAGAAAVRSYYGV